VKTFLYCGVQNELPEDVDDPDFAAESIGDYISDRLSLVGKGFQIFSSSTVHESEDSVTALPLLKDVLDKWVYKDIYELLLLLYIKSK
jgi:hypothetical protein